MKPGKVCVKNYTAQSWFAEHPEQKELLANVKEKPGF